VGWLSVHFVLTHCRANQDITPVKCLTLLVSIFLRPVSSPDSSTNAMRGAHQLEGGPLQGVLCTIGCSAISDQRRWTANSPRIDSMTRSSAPLPFLPEPTQIGQTCSM
jgi:hypothetical protein